MTNVPLKGKSRAAREAEDERLRVLYAQQHDEKMSLLKE